MSSQFVIQIRTSDGWLAKSFKVNGASIPEVVPEGRIQVVMTNETSFDDIVADYQQYTTQLHFSYDEPESEISCTGALTKTWPIN